MVGVGWAAFGAGGVASPGMVGGLLREMCGGLDFVKSALLPNQKIWLISELRPPMQKLFARGYREVTSERSCRGFSAMVKAQPIESPFHAWNRVGGSPRAGVCPRADTISPQSSLYL